MFGYVYRTLNKITGEVYVGKHASESYDPSYFGSGKRIKSDIKLYGRENFDNKIIDRAQSAEELNQKERRHIALYKDLYAKKCINLAEGGEGGSNLLYATEEERKQFNDKMTKINQARCRTDVFRENARANMIERYSHKEEREKQSKIVREAWSNEALKKEQSERLKKYYSTHKKDNSYNNRKCAMELNGETKIFKSRKELKAHLKSEYNVEFPNPKLKKLVDSGEAFIPFHKNQENLKKISGMRLYDISESVETKGDECSPVGQR